MDAPPVFIARGLAKTYRMGEAEVQALRGVDLEIRPGEFIVMLGPSGSGKSTLLNILGGLDTPTAGDVRFLDHQLTGADEADLTRYRREHVGFVFQFYNLIPSLTARENVALVTDISANPMAPEEALAWVGLAERLDHFPSQLSGGEQQRVAIARAIAKRPQVLLCDEPTGALDYATGKLVLDVIARVNRELGTTAMVITHNASIAGMADRVLKLGDGRIVSETRPERKLTAAEISLVKALDRKLLRDLWSLKTQVLSIALVIACGIGGFIGSLSTHASLLWSRGHYYDTARFPHVFATAKRAPASLVEKIHAIPGVVEAETRVVRDAQLSLEGVAPPMIARLIGVDFAHPPGMNRLTLTAGRWPAARSRGEAVVNQRFFEARGLALGATVNVLMNGRLERLAIVGTALTPEYIYATRGGGMPDDEWFAILWIDAEELAAACDMEGAFNSALLRLERGASVAGAIAALDRILEPYGGLGAVGREDQVSDKILRQEIDQQRVFGTVLPAIFLAVAAFILNVVLHRQVSAQRAEIAALKAVGYPDRRIAAHYLEFASVIVILGVAIGVGLGAWLGHAMTGLYTSFFHFPEFNYLLPAWLVAAGALAALAAAFGGALAAMRSILRLRAAEAMRAPAPARFRPLLLERLGWARLLTPAQRMIMRNLERKPLRAAITVLGIAGSAAILISGTFWGDALDWFMDTQFNKVNRSDVQIGFAEPVARSTRFDLGRLPGVKQVEVTRQVAVKLHARHRSYRTAITGVADDATLLRILDGDLREARASPDGLLLTARLAQRLGVRPGDMVRVELLEGRRTQADIRVAATVDEMVGMNAWMRLPELNRFAREGDVVSVAQLLVDRGEESRLLARLKEMPAAAVVIVSRTLLDTFRETNARNVLFFTAILTAFAAVIAVGVVYNNARIQLAERAWELASLRVLGFTRQEVSVLLLGELAIEIGAAIPLGLVAGFWLAALLLALMPHEVLEFPLVIYPGTYLYAAATVVGAGVASALVVRHRIDHLDLVAVLKSRE